ncbi:MAG: type III pantothenate kinase [Desulfatiglans sp.]|jgi:type III pantothenate kinase|nr:type III pantothenate kinase [Desulfatiglans sp.]
MLLCIDVGNTNIVMGVFDQDSMIGQWRVRTEKDATSDELGILICSLFKTSNIKMDRVSGIIIASVVPPLILTLEGLSKKYFNIKPVVVGHGLKTGMPIRYDNPKEVGADRIVNSVSAYEKYRCGLIIVDFGTATTFDCITAEGEWIGGAISPGLIVSGEALFSRTSRLPRIETYSAPKNVIAKNTISAMNVGIIYGYAGLVDGLVTRLKKEMGHEVKVIATGGVAPLIAKESATIDLIDENLTLEGLKLLYERNS